MLTKYDTGLKGLKRVSAHDCDEVAVQREACQCMEPVKRVRRDVRQPVVPQVEIGQLQCCLERALGYGRDIVALQVNCTDHGEALQ